MTVRYLVAVGLSGLLCVASVSATDDHDKHDKRDAPVGLLKAVREATQDFRDVNLAMGAGYASVAATTRMISRSSSTSVSPASSGGS